ncbi:MAG: nitrilase-related carbon-nitrogen hydrolase [Planctomycetota bacterium]
MRVALVEADTVWEDPAANRARLRELTPAADVAVLPELAFTGFTMDPRPDPDAEPFLIDLARERGQAIVAGYVGEGPRNVAVAVDPAGAVLARYAKLHPFTYADEHRHYRSGDDLPVFGLGGARAAMLICYDLRFPEAFREAALKGAEIFFVIANWPARRVEHWRALLRARAIENQAFVVGVNRVGTDPRESYVSSSLVAGPRGDVVHEGPGVVDVDPEVARDWRREFPALHDVRTDRYRFPG